MSTIRASFVLSQPLLQGYAVYREMLATTPYIIECPLDDMYSTYLIYKTIFQDPPGKLFEALQKLPFKKSIYKFFLIDKALLESQ